MKSILIVELSTSHTEIIEPLVQALPGCRVDLAIQDCSLDKIKNQRIFSKIHVLSALNPEQCAADVIQHGKYDLIIYNSAQGKNIRNLVLKTYFNPIPVIGIHHNPVSLIHSFTQKFFINLKIKKYIVLADFNKEFLLNHGVSADDIISFYPVLPKTPVFNVHQHRIISIPGVLELDRRDYLGLVQYVTENKSELTGYQFALLGNSQTHQGPQIKAAVQRAGVSDHFIFFDGYVSDETMDSYLVKSKFVMPLLHSNCRYFHDYFHSKISGAYNLAYAYHLPLLMHDVFSTKDEFSKNCVFYNFQNLGAQITLDVQIDKNYYKKFDLSFQSQKLLSFLFQQTPSFSSQPLDL